MTNIGGLGRCWEHDIYGIKSKFDRSAEIYIGLFGLLLYIGYWGQRFAREFCK